MTQLFPEKFPIPILCLLSIQIISLFTTVLCSTISHKTEKFQWNILYTRSQSDGDKVHIIPDSDVKRTKNNRENILFYDVCDSGEKRSVKSNKVCWRGICVVFSIKLENLMYYWSSGNSREIRKIFVSLCDVENRNFGEWIEIV